jgi:hypothetical protein
VRCGSAGGGHALTERGRVSRLEALIATPRRESFDSSSGSTPMGSTATRPQTPCRPASSTPRAPSRLARRSRRPEAGCQRQPPPRRSFAVVEVVALARARRSSGDARSRVARLVRERAIARKSGKLTRARGPPPAVGACYERARLRLHAADGSQQGLAAVVVGQPGIEFGPKGRWAFHRKHRLHAEARLFEFTPRPLDDGSRRW